MLIHGITNFDTVWVFFFLICKNLFFISVFIYAFFFKVNYWLLLSCSISFEGENQKICAFKSSFSSVSCLHQTVCWFCYNTAISGRESLLLTSLSCIYIVQSLKVGLLLGDVTEHIDCFFCWGGFTIDLIAL